MKKHNFYAGPAILTETVKQQAAEATLDFAGTGLSVMEVSHRSKEVAAFMNEAEALVRELLGVTEDYHVLFLTGGASSQFFMSVMNILKEGEKAAYIDTGSWSKKAIKEAKLYGDIEVVASSGDRNYSYLPKSFDIPSDAAFAHITSNNTIFGTQWQEWPETHVPFVADMSSDIFSRKLPIDRFGVIYAGAQKNLGPAGTTLVIVHKDMVERSGRTMTSMLNYKSHIDKGSLYNTGPVFPIYVSYLTLKWLKANGGLETMEERNKVKADALYAELERNPLVVPFVTDAADRSKMNVTFTLSDDDLNDKLKALADEAGCIGIGGHRSVGGFRASIYNAMEKESVDVLIDVLKRLEEKYG